MDFHTAQNDFLDYCAAERRLSALTVQAYGCDLVDFRRWLGCSTLLSICERTLRDYLADMVAKRGLSTSTVRRRLACLRAFFRFLTASGTVGEDPFALWRPRLARVRRLPRALARTETQLLLDVRQATDGDQLPLALRLMVATGLRVSELCRLDIEDLSADGGAFRIVGKGARDRIAYVTDPGLQTSLRKIAASRAGPGGRSPLLVNRRGDAMRPQSIRAMLRRHAAAVGIARRVTPHMLRHTAATLLIENGVDIRFVQRLLGHSSIATTEIYTHVADEQLRSALTRADVLRALGVAHRNDIGAAAR